MTQRRREKENKLFLQLLHSDTEKHPDLVYDFVNNHAYLKFENCITSVIFL